MSLFNIISCLGGLGMFLYGIKLLGSRLERCAGGKLEKILEKLTSSTLMGIISGAVVTAAIQSSGAVTVMLVGFVGSGLMQIEQTVGVIMGAGIGTTATSWILSLSQLGGTGTLIALLKPENFSPVLIFIGAAAFLFFDSEKVQNFGNILLGFGLLMYGMSVMSDSMSPIAQSSIFQKALSLLKNPFFGVLAGTALTAVLQSSSASVGVLQAISATGSITLKTAIPILVGENIGACVTALISALGSSKKAKQTALIQMYYKLISGSLFLAIYYLYDFIFKIPFIDNPANAVQIASIHTLFNVLSAIITLPFSRLLVKLAKMTVREKETERPTAYIDKKLLRTPEFALESYKNSARKIIDGVLDCVRLSVALTVENFDEKNFSNLCERKESVDKRAAVLDDALTKISFGEATVETSRTASMLLYTVRDAVKISERCLSLGKTARKLFSQDLAFSVEEKKELPTLGILLTKLSEKILLLPFTYNHKNDYAAEDEISAVIELSSELKKATEKRIRMSCGTLTAGLSYLEIINDTEIICDRCSSIALYTSLCMSDSTFKIAQNSLRRIKT